MGGAFRCEVCGTEPRWRVERIGDAVVTWACILDLAEVCRRLQRDGELTTLMVYMERYPLEGTG